MDPDRIQIWRACCFRILGGTVSPSTLTFDITGSVNLNTPTNALSTTVPQEISLTKPVFQWAPYSSTSDYIIEVVDASSGVVIWGGFEKNNDVILKKIIIPSSSTSVSFIPMVRRSLMSWFREGCTAGGFSQVKMIRILP